jgi:signal transduction histidine kinase/ActR/RegA family two-component response regulator
MSQQATEAGPNLSALGDIPLGLAVLDRDWCFTYLNPIAERFFEQLSGRPREQLLGKNIWQECREVADSAFAKEYGQAAAEGRTFEMEAFYPALNRWFLLLATPSEDARHVYFQDITARKSLERTLYARLEEMAAADRGKDEFLVHLAHEVRNALATIQNSLYLAGDGPTAGRARAVGEREIRSLSGLMDSLLQVSQLALGRIRPNPAAVDLAEVIAQAAQEAMRSTAARGRSFTVNLPADPLWVEADPAHLEQALTHLLDSVTRFTQVGNQIWVSAERQGGEVVVRVEDNGVGLPAEALPRIFDLFMQADVPVDRTQAGLGLGLALVRRLIELQGGAVAAFSEGPGKGSVFTVRLLVPAVVPPQEPAEGPKEGRRPLRVLVVDNNPEAADSLALLLTTWGYEIRVTYDGPSALEAAREWDPQVVLLDIGMPGMDGYEVARRLRAGPGAEALTLIAVTGYNTDEHRERSRAAGFHYHMVKPVPPEDLKALLTTVEAQRPRQGEGLHP